MSITPNKTFVYKRIPTRLPVAGDHVIVEDRPIDLDAPLDNGSFLIKGIYASFDPYQRGGMRDPSIKNWLQAYSLDSPVPTSVIGKVLKSACPNFVVDDIVHVWFAAPTAEYGVIPAGVPATKLDVPQGVDVAHFLGALGLPGLTAIRGLLDIGKPKKGEVMFVSSAAGAISEKNVPVQEQRGVRNMVQFTDKQLTMTGYLVDFTPESLQEFYETVIPMLQSGKLKAKLSITEGIENAAEGFVGMLAGENFGKAVLKI
ncbi:zinc-binding dehydrogenase [Colletotrichum tofieldiae]|nr:zinc-binding dehydrogenase [Colletotrichum tofieldiae]